MRIGFACLALVLLAGCTTPATPSASPAATVVETPSPREPFSFEALRANASGYVAQRYQESELPAALIADLTADGFECQHSATMSECSRAVRATPVCFNVAIVRISATAPVQAEQNTRCMGANP